MSTTVNTTLQPASNIMTESAVLLVPFPGAKINWIILAIVISLGSIFLYMAIMAVIAKRGIFHNSGYIMIFNISCAQMMAAIFYSLLGSVEALLYRNGFVAVNGNNILNRAIVGVSFVTYYCSVLTLVIVAVQRFIAVFFFRHYQRIFTTRTTAVCITLCWLFGLGVGVPCVTGPCIMYYSPITLSFWGNFANPYTQVYATFGLYFPIFSFSLMIILYSMIIYKLKKIKKQIGHSTSVGTDTANSSNQSPKRDDVRLCYQFIWISVIYMVPILEFTFIQISLQKGTINFTPEEWAIEAAVQHMIWTINYCCDPYIHLIINRKLRENVMALLCGNLCKANIGHGETGTTGGNHTHTTGGNQA